MVFQRLVCARPISKWRRTLMPNACMLTHNRNRKVRPHTKPPGADILASIVQEAAEILLDKHNAAIESMLSTIDSGPVPRWAKVLTSNPLLHTYFAIALCSPFQMDRRAFRHLRREAPDPQAGGADICESRSLGRSNTDTLQIRLAKRRTRPIRKFRWVRTFIQKNPQVGYLS